MYNRNFVSLLYLGNTGCCKNFRLWTMVLALVSHLLKAEEPYVFIDLFPLGGLGVFYLYLNKNFTDILTTCFFSAGVCHFLVSFYLGYHKRPRISQSQRGQCFLREQTKYHHMEKMNFLKN